MPRYSDLTPYGQLEYSSEPSDAEKIYDASVAAYTDPRTGTPAIDMTIGTYHEAKLYARSLALADAQSAVKRAANQDDALKATEGLPHFERKYRITPPHRATLDTRRTKAAARRRISRGNRFEALHEALSTILGSTLIAIRPIAPHEAVRWPANPGAGPGVFVRPERPSQVIRLTAPVTLTGAPSTIGYENWDATQPPLQLVKGDVLAVQPENLGLAEKVTIAATAGAGVSRTLTATFAKAHDQFASASTGPVPIWWSTLGHILVVVTHEAALNAELVAEVDEYLGRALKGGTTWSVVEPSVPGDSMMGPFTLDASPLGAVPISALPIVALAPPFVGAPAPASVTTGGSTLVRLYGKRFAEVTDVQVDGVSVAFTVVNDYELTFTTSTHVAGDVPLTVVSPYGTTTRPAALTFEQAPLTISSVTPNTGPAAGGTALVVAGTGFFAAMAVSLPAAAPSLAVWSVVDDNTIHATTEADVAGLAYLQVVDGIGNFALHPFTFT